MKKVETLFPAYIHVAFKAAENKPGNMVKPAPTEHKHSSCTLPSLEV